MYPNYSINESKVDNGRIEHNFNSYILYILKLEDNDKFGLFKIFNKDFLEAMLVTILTSLCLCKMFS